MAIPGTAHGACTLYNVWVRFRGSSLAPRDLSNFHKDTEM